MRTARHIALVLLVLQSGAWAADDEAMGRRVQELLRAHQADVFGCVQAAQAKAEGEMLVRVWVGEGGRVAKAEVLKDESSRSSGCCGPKGLKAPKDLKDLSLRTWSTWRSWRTDSVRRLFDRS